MKKSLLLLSACLTLGILRAQTVDEIVGHYMDALGGKEKLLTIKSVSMSGVATMNNNEVTTTTTRVQDKLYRSESNFGMGSFVLLVTPDKGWSMTPRSGGAFEEMPAERVTALQYQMDCQGPLTDYAAKGHKAELLGREDVDGASCYKLKLTLKTGNDITYFIHPDTWYIVRESTKGGMMGGGGRPGGGGGNAPAESITNYSNYEKTSDGYVFPMTISRGFGGALNVETIEVNKPVDEKLFKAE